MNTFFRLSHLIWIFALAAGTAQAALPVVTLKAGVSKTAEGSKAPATFVIERTGSTTAALVVNLTQVSGMQFAPGATTGQPNVPSAVNGVDVSKFSTSVSIPKGTNRATLAITALNDNAKEGLEQVTLHISRSTSYTRGTARSATVYIEDAPLVPPNLPPVVELTAPASSMIVLSNQFQLSAVAKDPDGTIDYVEFLNGDSVVGTVKTPPYNFLWKDLISANYQVRARAVDSKGAKTTTPAVRLTVIAPNVSPVVKLVSPTNNTVLRGVTNVTLKAEASDRDGKVLLIRFKVDGKVVKETTGSSFVWTNAPLGEHVIQAEALDNEGALGESEKALLVLKPVNLLPTVQLIAPTNGFTARLQTRSIELHAEAADPDGRIVKVEFLADGKVFATSTQRATPFNYYRAIWTNAVDGVHHFEARAFDDAGDSVLSKPVEVNILVPNNPPSVLASPATGVSGFYWVRQSLDVVVSTNAPATVVFDLTAADADSDSIAEVRLLLNGKTVASVKNPAAKSQVTVKGLEYGTYSIATYAVDSRGLGAFLDKNERLVITPVSTPTSGKQVVIKVEPAGLSGSTVQGVVQATVSGKGVLLTAVDLLLDGEPVAHFAASGNTSSNPFKVEGIKNGFHVLTALMHLSDGTVFFSERYTFSVFKTDSLSVSIVSPKSGFEHHLGQPLEIEADVKVTGATVSVVRFIATNDKGLRTLIKTDTTAPYSASWAVENPAVYQLTAEAVDSKGLTVISDPVKVSILPKLANLPPKVDIVSPPSGFVADVGSIFEVSIQTADADGYVPQVELLDGDKVVDSQTRQYLIKPKNGEIETFTFILKGLSVGRHSLRARATDDARGVSLSSVVIIDVRAKGLVPSVVTVYAGTKEVQESPGKPGSYFKVVRDGDKQSPLVVRYSLSGTAKNGVDYLELPGRVTIPAGSESVAIDLVPIPDKALESNETVVLTLLGPDGVVADYSVGTPASAVMEIIETPTGNVQNVVSVSADQPFLQVGTGLSASFTFSRTGTLTEPLTVTYSISGTAVAGTDYEKLSGSVVIPKGETKAIVSVKPKGATLAHNPGTVTLSLDPQACVLIFPPPLSCYLIGAESKATVVLVEKLILVTDPSLGFANNVLLFGSDVFVSGGLVTTDANGSTLVFGTNTIHFAGGMNSVMPMPAAMRTAPSAAEPLLLEGFKAGQLDTKEVVLFAGNPLWTYAVEYSEDGGKEWKFLTNAGPVSGLFAVADAWQGDGIVRIYRARMISF